jgi:N-acetylmuramoyl-L-alanine amidase
LSLGAFALVVEPASASEVTPQRHAVANSVTLELSDAFVSPNSPVVMTASVYPVERNRTVVLREFSGSHFRNLASAVTNPSGNVTFSRSFASLGTVRLRAEILATAGEPHVVGHAVTEQVVSVLPFVLPAGAELRPGDQGPLVADMQTRLTNLGYWLGGAGGYFGDGTEQAVYALEKAAGIARSGVVDPAFVAALNADTVPVPKTTSGDGIDVDLTRDLVEIVHNGKLEYTLNTSTGGGYTYTQSGATYVALTPKGIFQTNRVVNGIVVDVLGQLWRPRFFDAGFAIHGDTYVPPYPESHGCVRVSNEAINWIWANNIDPVGMTVWVYQP